MKKVLLCLDSDPQPSVFDAVVAVDAGADQLLRHGGVEPDGVEPLVHGVMFTRGPADLKNSSVFVGGSNVAAAEALFDRVTKCFFGPMRVSALIDANGSNTTAAAAVVAAGRHAELASATAVVVGAGPVGQRAALLLASEGATVRLASRTKASAAEASAAVIERIADASITPHGADDEPLTETIQGANVLIAAGPAGVELLDEESRAACESLRVVVDLNAVPPLGVGGIGVTDKAVTRGQQVHYGAIGVGGDKMRVHKAAIRRLFESNDAVLDAAEVYAIAKQLEADRG